MKQDVSFVAGRLAEFVPRQPSPDDNLITAVFEGARLEVPEPNGRDPMGRAFKVVEAPEILNYRHRLEELVRFLTKIRRAVLRRDRSVLIDLSACRSIDIFACLLLTAEIERCQELCPGSVYGCDPSAADALNILRQFGFHEQLNMGGHTSHPDSEWTATIRSGKGRAEPVSPILAEVANLALKAWGDQAFTDQIHAALNEAMTNVIMHAYPPEMVDCGACLPGRWWAAGVVNRETNEAWFFALDQGVGIPQTAIRTYDGLLERFQIDRNLPHDHLVIAAAIKESRTQTGLDQHGKGLASMIRLIDEKSAGGLIMIASLQGEHIVVKNPTKPHPILQRIEFGRMLEAQVPGTLIAWKVNGPMLAAEGGSS